MEYFIAINEAQQGPFPMNELIGRGMKAETLVWREGMAQWVSAQSVPELQALLLPPLSAPSFPTPQRPSVGTAPGYPVAPLPYGSPYYAPQMIPGQSNKLPAGLCALLIGALGIHKFILGRNGAGLTMLLVSILTCGIGAVVMHVIGIIEGIIYLTKSDEEFHQSYVVERRSWF